MSNRQSLDDGIELNSLLLNEATTLAAITIVMLSSNSCPEVEHRLEIAARACAVSDILCWEEVTSLQISPDLATQVANKVAANLGVQGFDEAPVVPCHGPQGDCPIIAWRTPTSARPWVTDLATFAPKIAALYEPEMGIAPIWSGLGDRIDKLNGYLFDHSEEYETSPTGNERAELASCIAKALAANTRTSMARWTMFYNDPNSLSCRSTRSTRESPVVALLGQKAPTNAQTRPGTKPTQSASVAERQSKHQSFPLQLSARFRRIKTWNSSLRASLRRVSHFSRTR